MNQLEPLIKFMDILTNFVISFKSRKISNSLTPKILCAFFTKICSFWHNWKNQIFQKIIVWEFKELIEDLEVTLL